MLHIYFGDMPEAIYNTDTYFNHAFTGEWLEDDFAKAVVKGIDKSLVSDQYLIHSPILGMIPPFMLSGGTKTLLLIKNCPDQIFNASMCCDKCAKYILRLSKKQDIRINLRHIMNFKAPFKIFIENDGIVVEDMDQLLMVATKYV